VSFATIAAALTVRDQIIGALSGNAALVALLATTPQGAPAILPTGTVDPQLVHKPFLWVINEGGGPPDDAGPDLVTFSIEAHERPGYGLVKLDTIVGAIRLIFDGRRWELPTGGGPGRAYYSEWIGATGELPDPGFKTIKRKCRVRLYMSP